ncbi:MAG: pyruvate:ferredoxin (flavodoxin) oxidoreductase [Gammaproteobacteria bacterium]|nr:pyruvate:ferredoxin (flavodoxin) oxidoreductase [Gammaproteobacteria bacterium]MBT3724881.1 pyruvate:ferredoxin (flavodoxin) oxidoreductase [Gammaproteobacteria bacterium]MBT4192956.1 pyruvate:ferredoxin (flavodoxin) oxidoreductase [Gammaproteobacteria bacterium]MBT4450892.1 pyruvate:ferredoxin (flavodoxin) oxidoreductase [Gammaproteobacteria bacterium]MBT4860230.1 pyruvate:ferredoxin (flavodoxin) oxidoreductase [Gammaproteobacteria bacterium]
MNKLKSTTIDGNQAAATIAHLCNEVIAIYPITPASPMGEWSDEWSSRGQKNLWGTVPDVVEMQSEAGAAGAIHGALQTGALTTTFTASQGLLLMLPNMYKIAGELTPTVFHISARSLACQALSIFGDHSDVMSARATGFALLASNSPQEVLDLALISQAASLQSKIPVLHFFDGFRTSHELSKLDLIDTESVRAMISDELIADFRSRAMTPENPVLRGSSQNPDVYFQARETVNPFYQKMPDIVQQVMDQFANLTGRQYQLFEYVGHPEAEKVIMLMGSGAETAHETVDYLTKNGEKIGMIKIRLFRPLDVKRLLQVIPLTVTSIAVLDRTKEPGAAGEPLYKDVVTAFAEQLSDEQPLFEKMPKIVGGRYGLSSKEFTPGMVKAIFDMLAEQPKNNFTIGIHDDVSFSSLLWDDSYRTEANKENFQAMFYGLGSDGTVSANKNSIKIIGESTDLKAQGYFVYDSKKSGAVTVSHLRFGPEVIRSTYLIGNNDANFIACHQSGFLQRFNMLDNAADNAVFLLNSTLPVDQVWNSLPAKMQQQCIDKKIKLYVIDAYAVALKAGMGKRINTIMQTCFFAISGVLPQQQAIESIKQAVVKSYGRKGQRIVDMNFKAIDETLACLQQVELAESVSSQFEIRPPVSPDAPEFVQNVTAHIIAGKGDSLPVSALPVDGTYPTGTAAYEKRNLALEIPVWENDICSQCGKCPMVCPHAAIRSKIFNQQELDDAPQNFKSMPMKGKGFAEGSFISYQVAPEDCTGCGLCVDICPIRDKSNASRKALNMRPIEPLLEQEKENWTFYLQIPETDRTELKINTIKGAMALEPLFEFSGSCSGCGETPYVKLASQLFGDRMLVANATGCSSIYGGNLPTTPWTTNSDGRGPAWNNSLFEDNAEFGLGMRVAADKHKQQAIELLLDLKPQLDSQLVDEIIDADELSEAGISEQRERVKHLNEMLDQLDSTEATLLKQLTRYLCRLSVWIMGGDGWAYDIGYGGLDHVLASGRNVNILVLDTEVYSNTGGQTSKATPRGAVAKFSSGGKATAKKDLAMLAMDYENVYVAHVAYGAKDVQTLRTFIEAEAHDGPSVIIAYSPCIAHGVDLSNNHRQQQLAVNSGHWPLFRYDPVKASQGQNPLHMDSKEPSIAYRDYVMSETRFNMLWHTHPEDAEKFVQQAQQEVNHRYHYYKQLSELEWDDQTTLKSAQAKLADSKNIKGDS